MKFVAFLISFVSMVLIGIFSLYTISFVRFLDGEKPIINDKQLFEKLKIKLAGKNYLQKNNKVYVVSNYIITPNTKIGGVIEINGEKKNFEGYTLNDIKKLNGIGKIYVTKIGDITLKGTVIINNYQGGTLIHGDIDEKNGKK